MRVDRILRPVGWGLVAIGVVAGSLGMDLVGRDDRTTLALGLTVGDRPDAIRWCAGLAALGRFAAVALLARRYRPERRGRWGVLLHLAALAGMLEVVPEARAYPWAMAAVWAGAVIVSAGIAYGVRHLGDVLMPAYAVIQGAVQVGVVPAAGWAAGWGSLAGLIGVGALAWGAMWRLKPLAVTGAAMLLTLCAIRPVATLLVARSSFDDLGRINLGDLQFGDIDGDGNLDLMTWGGYGGRGAGNIIWWTGTGSRFAPRSTDGKGGTAIESNGWAVVCDADGDGDPDVVALGEVAQNDGRGGLFPAGRPWVNRKLSLYDVGPEWVFEIISVDLDGKIPPELFARHFGSVLAIGRGPGRWEFIDEFAKVAEVDFAGAAPTLVGPPELAARAASLGLRYRSRRPIPLDLMGRLDLGDWLDLDGDGRSELAIVELRPDRDTRHRVYRERADGWELLATIELAGYRGQPAPALRRWVDVDRDGDLDLVADDGRIYRHDPPFRFTPARTLEVEPARYYAVDVDGDGWPDVVSSVRPWVQLIRGPLLLAAPASR